MSVEAWTFLVSRNRYLDYRTVLAPDFVSGSTTFLARAAGGDLSEVGQANYREIHNSKDGDITLIFRVVEATGRDIGEEDIGTLKDSFGRVISLIEGIVIPGRHPYIQVSQETFNYVHTLIIDSYCSFWNKLTPEVAQISQSFKLSNVEQESCLRFIQLETLNLEANSTKVVNQTQTWDCTQKLPAEDIVSYLICSTNNEILAVTERPNLTIWAEKEPAHYNPDRKFGHTKFVVPSSDGEEFAICYVSLAIPPTKDFIILWNRKTERRLEFNAPDRKWVDKITSVAISPDKQVFATCNCDGSINIWDISSQMELGSSLKFTGCVRSSAFSPNGQLLASGYDDGTINLWKRKTARIDCSSNLHKASVRVVTFSPNGQFLASGDSQGNIKLWDVQTLEFIKKLDSAHTLSVNTIAFSPDGSVIASGGDDGFLKLWSVKTGVNLFTSFEEKEAINAVAFSGDGRMLISGGGDRYVRIWRQG